MLKHQIVMFVVNIIIGICLNPMNLLAYRFNDLYFTSTTLIFSALLMASNMCILEILMYYNYSGKFNINLFYSILK